MGDAAVALAVCTLRRAGHGLQGGVAADDRLPILVVGRDHRPGLLAIAAVAGWFLLAAVYEGRANEPKKVGVG